MEAPPKVIRLRVEWPMETGPERARQQMELTSRWSEALIPLTAEDIRIHAWLIERLAALHHERHGLWPRLRRFFFGDRKVR